MDEGIAIATAISRAKDWAANRGQPVESKRKTSTKTDKKKHGQDVYIIPGKNGWAVKKEKSDRKHLYESRAAAVKEGRKEAKEANSSITIKDSHGKIKERKSYNPNRRKTRTTHRG
jgi:hypothetical protein